MSNSIAINCESSLHDEVLFHNDHLWAFISAGKTVDVYKHTSPNAPLPITLRDSKSSRPRRVLLSRRNSVSLRACRERLILFYNKNANYSGKYFESNATILFWAYIKHHWRTHSRVLSTQSESYSNHYADKQNRFFVDTSVIINSGSHLEYNSWINSSRVSISSHLFIR